MKKIHIKDINAITLRLLLKEPNGHLLLILIFGIYLLLRFIYIIIQIS